MGLIPSAPNSLVVASLVALLLAVAVEEEVVWGLLEEEEWRSSSF